MEEDFSNSEFELAETYLQEKRVAEIQFSGGTYQVRVIDAGTDQSVWCFLQMNEQEELVDDFCSCEQEKVPCVHIAAAWLRIYNDHTHPLHVRFTRSLWNQLCQIYAQKLGDSFDQIHEIAPWTYESHSATHKCLFSLKLKSNEALQKYREITERRPKETEETSLKFSNLPTEEIALWREGRPSFHLRYELSFWSDLAKWLMLLQDEGEGYEIQFSFSDEGFPNQIRIRFKELEVEFYLSKVNLERIIPSLTTVLSPLKVYAFNEESINFISYDEATSSLQIHRRDTPLYNLEETAPKATSVESLEEWLYVKGEGFYAKEEKFLFSSAQIPKEQIAKALDEHSRLLERYLIGTRIHREPLIPSYTLSFDEQGNLSILTYLFEVGDLEEEGSADFGQWVYLKDRGFYRLEERLFTKWNMTIPHDHVSDFVSRNRIWLNKQEGFHTHIASLETQLGYILKPDRTLCIVSLTSLSEQLPFSRDFGEWIFIDKEGFYAKYQKNLGPVIQAGLEVKAEEVASFIAMYSDELHYIKGFFASHCPVVKSGLSIQLQEDRSIVVSPKYELKRGYTQKSFFFFDDVIYVEGEGFYKLPVEKRLPSRFRHPLSIKAEEVDFFILNDLPKLLPCAFSLDRRLRIPSLATLTLNHVQKDSESSLSLSMSYETEWGSVEVADLWKAIQRKQKYIFSPAGLIDVESKQFQWISQLHPQFDFKKKRLKLSVMELLRLHAVEKINERVENEAEKLLWKQILTLQVAAPPDLTLLQSSLRSYQQAGVEWLWSLHCNHLSGLLCDDMGLGKTHQAMALLAACAVGEKEGRHPRYLVVCPTSVIYHWEEKLSHFLPHLKVLTFYGAGRSLEVLQDGWDLLLTSYGVLRVEQQLLTNFYFDVIILDEIQVAKNHQSRIHKALLSLQGRTRIGLTGTPIENHLRELKALFDLVLPSYMPSESSYRDLFVTPIEKFQDPVQKALLARFIKPFVLRRKKTDVLLDLPEKTEEIAYCSLSEEQKNLYRRLYEKEQVGLLKALEDTNRPVPYVNLFALLTKLKQVCDHPALVLDAVDHYQQHESGKWDLFKELLGEARESGQKVVVFSHYLKMIEIMTSYLTESGVHFASVIGQTIERREELRRFQEDPQCEVFVGSLQAVGLGVDLTAASVVIHYDRWWNAARENQATDRVYRIGQQRGVQVFKLVTKNTLEERIDQMIAKKSRLMEEIVGVDAVDQLKLLGREEWLELFKTISLTE